MRFKAYQLTGLWHWTLYDDDSEIVCVSPVGYKTKFDCLSAIKKVKLAATASIEGFKVG